MSEDSTAASTSQSPASDSDLPNNATTSTVYDSGLNPYTTPTTALTTTTLATMTSTADSSFSSSNSSAPTSPCPSANNTLITQPLGSRKYRIYCDSDFGGGSKKTLASVVLPSFEE
ncbi:uncharacterized protein BDV17DRAFT_258607 [Aspergillus undulatus]|uniref:uncharacterized protein n=1 Tax=Aspergillus undulatus TaxID=1810928 RepID=UPI003CCD54E6